MHKNRQHPTEVECRLFCCPILLGRCRFCSFLKLLSYRHTAKPDFLYKRQSPVPTLAFGRRYGNNNENNSTWIHDRGITIKGNRTLCCPRTTNACGLILSRRDHAHTRKLPLCRLAGFPQRGGLPAARAAGQHDGKRRKARMVPRKENFIPSGRRSSWSPAGCYPEGAGHGKPRPPRAAGQGHQRRRGS